MFGVIRNWGSTEKIAVLSFIVSIVSVVIAIFTLVIDYKSLEVQEPNIVVEQDIPKVTPYFDSEDNNWKMLSYNRLTIKNTGGKTVTLLGMKPPRGLPVLMGLNSGNITDQSIKHTIIPIKLMFQDIKTEAIKDYKGASMEELSLLNIAIEPGTTLVQNYIIIFNVYEEQKRKVDLVLFNLDLTFGNEKVIPFKQGYPVPELNSVSN